jgi:hypothetical protein
VSLLVLILLLFLAGLWWLAFILLAGMAVVWLFAKLKSVAGIALVVAIVFTLLKLI